MERRHWVYPPTWYLKTIKNLWCNNFQTLNVQQLRTVVPERMETNKMGHLIVQAYCLERGSMLPCREETQEESSTVSLNWEDGTVRRNLHKELLHYTDGPPPYIFSWMLISKCMGTNYLTQWKYSHRDEWSINQSGTPCNEGRQDRVFRKWLLLQWGKVTL